METLFDKIDIYISTGLPQNFFKYFANQLRDLNNKDYTDVKRYIHLQQDKNYNNNEILLNDNSNIKKKYLNERKQIDINIKDIELNVRMKSILQNNYTKKYKNINLTELYFYLNGHDYLKGWGV